MYREIFIYGVSRNILFSVETFMVNIIYGLDFVKIIKIKDCMVVLLLEEC